MMNRPAAIIVLIVIAGWAIKFLDIVPVLAKETLHKVSSGAISKAQMLTRDEADKLRSYLNAAEQGDAKAQIKVGDLYRVRPEFGHVYIDCDGPCPKSPKPEYSDIARNSLESLKWYRKAADQGDTMGQIKVGDFYDEQGQIRRYNKGYTGPVLLHGDFDHLDNYQEAMKWYLKAADKSANAMERIGWFYQQGKGVPASDSEALKWWKKAAERGDQVIVCHIGKIYAILAGNWDYPTIRQDNEEAYFWLTKCMQDGNANAIKLLGEVEYNLTPEQIATSNRRLENWQANLPPQTWREPKEFSY